MPSIREREDIYVNAMRRRYSSELRCTPADLHEHELALRNRI